MAAGRMRPRVSHAESARKLALCNLMAAMRARTVPNRSQQTLLVKSNSRGHRHEASISAGDTRPAAELVLPAASIPGSDGGAVIEGYSYLLGASGALGGAAAAFSARAIRLLRAAAGFL